MRYKCHGSIEELIERAPVIVEETVATVDRAIDSMRKIDWIVLEDGCWWLDNC